MATQPDALAALKTQPYFKLLDDDEIERLAHALIERNFDKDEMILVEGEACQGLYIVTTGSIKIFKLSPEGREQILTSVNANGSFNEVAVFDGGPNPANASALRPSTVWILPRTTIHDLIHRRPDVALAIIQNLGARLRHLVGLVEDLSLRHVSSRLAKLLLETASSQAHTLTQQEMASHLGTVREMIGRSLKQLESRGLITIERGKIIILDREALERML